MRSLPVPRLLLLPLSLMEALVPYSTGNGAEGEGARLTIQQRVSLLPFLLLPLALLLSFCLSLRIVFLSTKSDRPISTLRVSNSHGAFPLFVRLDGNERSSFLPQAIRTHTGVHAVYVLSCPVYRPKCPGTNPAYTKPIPHSVSWQPSESKSIGLLFHYK